jgi:toluene monooxygenase electron transfer component
VKPNSHARPNGWEWESQRETANMSRTTIRNASDGSEYHQIGDDTILRAALRANIGLSYECNSGGCGACKFELLEGQVKTLWDTAPGLTDRDKRRGRHLACQCRAEGDITIKAPVSPSYVPTVAPVRQMATLKSISDVSHDIREFCFESERTADFLPGQYAMLSLPQVTGERAYSMSNIGNDRSQWQFQIRRVPQGKGTDYLFNQLQVGDRIGLDGPYGLAYLRADCPRDIVCIGGGSGLAPMVSIARGAAKLGMLNSRKLYFLYGARTPKDVCGQEMLQTLQDTGANIHFEPVVSMPGEEWTGATGFVHESLSRVLPQALNQYEFYFAGPPPMTQAIQELLMLEHKVPFEQIHFDRFF